MKNLEAQREAKSRLRIVHSEIKEIEDSLGNAAVGDFIETIRKLYNLKHKRQAIEDSLSRLRGKLPGSIVETPLRSNQPINHINRI